MPFPLREILNRLRVRPAASLPPAALAPLLSAEEIAQLAVQAELLAEAQPAREVHDHHAGDWSSPWLGHGLDFEESRPYVAGDDIRDMDWRTTARTGRAYLKSYREERQPTLHLVLDREAGMRFGTRRRLKVTQAARAAALFAFAAAGHNAAIGGSLWDAADLELPPLHGRSGALALIEAAARPCPPLPDAAAEPVHYLDRLVALDAGLPRGAELIVLSDFAWLREVHEPLLARLAERMDLFAVQIIDPVERALPDVGLARFHDMTRGDERWIDTGHASIRADHAAAFRERQAAIAHRLARTGARHLVLGSEVDDLLPILLGHHA
ncbi:uncharacterized protein DUF58 [Sulfuritortus calidifontis]|uniref:Uncharacterized protein DUF58 n=1 Tax=Sulfuritortus calidifontis TaxID=1914471 RepID=A0A4R3JXD0_9PROT|nr:DUF58 domain-containing protein [Sulfuritortus calidifontis]TCS73093.1 uncharacterized protein DUF58 [Sulfuritortus calidifontis]